MNISFIGAGKVGTSFGKYLSDNGMHINYYLSRSIESAIKASEYLNCKYTDKLEELVLNSDIIFVTTSDNEIQIVSDHIFKLDLDVSDKIFVHMSGALTSDIFNKLESKGAKAYSLHPLQTFTNIEKAIEDLGNSYFSIESNSDKLLFTKLLDKLGNNYFTLTPEQKVKYHLSACVLSNYLVTLMDFGIRKLEEIGIDSDAGLSAMEPLIMATYNNVKSKGTTNALSGPVQRGDTKTIERHLDELQGLDLDLYKLLGKVTTERLVEENKKKILNEIWER